MEHGSNLMNQRSMVKIQRSLVRDQISVQMITGEGSGAKGQRGIHEIDGRLIKGSGSERQMTVQM